jgi:purine-binding chemotaxis protein CheW
MVEKVEIQERGINIAIDQETEGEDMSALAGKYLTFILAGEEYGIEILKVREIIGLMDITDVPRMPGYVRGVINLRGKVIPVVDLRTKFGMMSTEDTDETCIIVVDAAQDGKSSQTGILVDTVSEVLNITGGQIEKTPTFGAAMNTEFIMGMAKLGGDVKILLDIVAALS